MLEDILGKKNSKSKAGNILNWIIIVAVIIAIAVIAEKIFKAFNLGAKTLGDALGQKEVQVQTGIPPARQVFCKSVALDIDNAITRIPFLGYVITYNSTGIITALNKLVTTAEAQLTSELFKELHGESLKTNFVDHFYQHDQDQINKTILTAIQ